MAATRRTARRPPCRQLCVSTVIAYWLASPMVDVAFLTIWCAPLTGSMAFVLVTPPQHPRYHSPCQTMAPTTSLLPKAVKTTATAIPRDCTSKTSDGGMQEQENTLLLGDENDFSDSRQVGNDNQDEDDSDIHPSAAWLNEPDDDQDEDYSDIHPSAAWLNEPANNPISGGARLRRTLAVDYGQRRVGLAVGVGISPRVMPGVTNRGSNLEVVRQVLLRARGEGVRDVVVGFPLMRNGTESDMCYTVRDFALVLADAGAVSRQPTSVYLWDERFSSAQAEAMLDRHGGRISKKVEIDSLAAGLILQHYFASGGRGAEKVTPSGQRSPEILMAAGIADGNGGVPGAAELSGEDLKLKRYEERAEWLRIAAAGDFVPFMKPPKSKRKKRKR